MIKIGVVSLGCDKNRIDTENMLYYLKGGEYSVTDDYSEAEVIIINTCAFIESARIEAIDTILEMAEYKKSGKCQTLIVTGCLPQKYSKELKEELVEVDAFLGVDEYEKIGNCINSKNPVQEKTNKRILTTPQHYAYLRIADGCDNFCTFCTIPSIRGKYRSKTIEELMSETKFLISNGVKEIILIAQDVTSYGKDLYGKPSLVKLIKELTKLDLKWIRLMYCYPELVTDELIDEISSNNKVVKYIDIPLQHISNKVLRLMNRRSNGLQIRTLINKLRGKCPDIVIRSTFMVGFPGEGEEEFNELCDFCKEYKLERVGIFAYSKEEDTPSAKIKGHLSDEIKERRVEILGEILQDGMISQNTKLVGKTIDVIYEDIDYDRNMFVGRTQFDAPQIDSVVYFTGDFADVGEIYKIKITAVDGYDLKGELVQ